MNRIRFTDKCAWIFLLFLVMHQQPVQSGNLDELTTSLKTLSLKLMALHSGLDLYQRSYIRGTSKIPIRFYQQDILGPYVAWYNNTKNPDGTPKNPKDHIVPEHCHVVGGPFTYYLAIPLESNIYEEEGHPKDLYSDIAWGCAWRASLNLLNKVKEWLAANKKIYAKEDSLSNRQVNMYDLAQWTGWKRRLWIEPADNAELFLLFIEKWYKLDDQKKIHKFLGLRGYLYLDVNADADQKLLEAEKKNFLDSINTKQAARSELKKLRDYLEIEDSEDLKATVRETLEKLYTHCYSKSNIATEKFPKFDEEKAPFPVNVDDVTLGRNIYGFQAKAGTLTHLFIGETHIGAVVDYTGNPWRGSGWQKIEEIFNKSVMVFEIFIR